MGAGGRPQTIRVVFKKRMPDGAVRHSVPLYDSSAGIARAEHMMRYAQLVRSGVEGGALLSPALCELEPNFLMTAYIAVAHQEHELDPDSLCLDTMSVGDGAWLGSIRWILRVEIDMDNLYDDVALHELSESVGGWTC